VVVPFTVELSRSTPIVNSYKDLQIELKSWDGSDLLRGKGYGGVLFTQRAQDWFSERWGEYVEFDEFSAA
jgi:hypothetical protein